MLRSRFFWKLYLSYAALVFLVTAVIGVLVHFQLKGALISSLEQSLAERLNLIGSLGADLFDSDSSGLTKRRLKAISNHTNTVITLLKANGVVWVDSEQPSLAGRDYSLRPEIAEALSGKLGLARRYSSVFKHSRMYAAKTVRRNGMTIGVARISIPLSIEEAQLGSLRMRIFYGAAVGTFLALLMGGAVARRITVPLDEMMSVAESMREGEYDRRVRTLPKDEIGLLGDTFNRLGQELTQKISYLSHEEAQLRVILTNMIEGVIAIDEDDTILFCNRSAANLLGDQHQILPGKKIWHYTQLRDLREMTEKVRTSEIPEERELSLSLESRKVILTVRVTRFTGNDSTGIIIVLHDISTIRNLENMRRDFVGNVSHELKTPLTSIKGYVETLLEGGALDDRKNNRRFLRKVETNVNQLTNLVQDLLQIGRLESEQEVGISPVQVSLKHIAEEAVNQHEISLSQKKLSCQVTCPPDPVFIQGDPVGMLQVADNLLSNAVKYTPEGGKIDIRVYTEGSWGVLEVQDNGVGIPEKDLPRIFERFYRVDKARSRAMGGTGLGLAIVKHLIQTMRGEVKVESRLEQGSKFSVWLPVSQNFNKN